MISDVYRKNGSPGKPCVNIEQNSSIDITESEQEIADVRDTSELSSESLYLCIERFRGGVCGTVVKEVQDILVVIVNSLLDGPEGVYPGLLHIVEPSGQFGVCHSLDLCLRIDEPQLVGEGIGVSDVGIHSREARPPVQSSWKKAPDAGMPYSRTVHPIARRTGKEAVQYSCRLKGTGGHTCGQYYGKYETWMPFP